MVTLGLQLLLLLFGLVGFAGAGASVAVGRARRVDEGERDVGMLGVAVLLFVFGALCTALAAGAPGILAFGGVVTWFSYIYTSQHMGIFRVETPRRVLAQEEPTEESRRTF